MNLHYKESKEFKDYHEERRLERRLSLIKYVTLSILILYLLNFWFLQIIKGKDYSNQAKSNYLKAVILRPDRGLIKDSYGEIIATNRPSFNIIISRENNLSIHKDIKDISPILKVKEENLKLRLEKMQHLPETEPLIAKEDVLFDDMAYIESRREEYPNVSVHVESKRYYFNAHAAHILGYIGEVSEKEIDGKEMQRGDIIGKAGIEKRYDAILRGSKGRQLIEVDSMGRKIKEISFNKTWPIQGLELQLTIDMRLQEELSKAFRGETGAAVFMNPDDGEIYALYSSPFYDPNDFAGHLTLEKWKDYCSNPQHPLLNRATQAVYPPGSTFKILIAIAALEKGLINENTTFYCSGSTVIHGRRLHCWHKGGHGFVNLHEAIVHSCNIYFYNLGKMLDIDDIYESAARFGFGETSGIDLDYELSGLMPNRAWKEKKFQEEWYPGETISVSIGQGPIQVTPLQMANFISMIANGGKHIRPHIRQEADENNPSTLIGVSNRTIDLIKNALRGVVNERGTGWRAKIEGKEVCGKTGTAQISAATALKDSRTLPKEEREHAWFIGFAPREDPEISFAIIVEHGGYGGESAAPIAKNILEVFFEHKEQEKQKTGEDLKRAGFKDDVEKTVWEN